jgi:uncharacterized membrane protein
MASAPRDESISIGRVLQRGFQTMARNILVFLGASLLLAGLPALAINYFVASGMAGGEPDLAVFGTTYLLLTLLTWFGTTLLQAALVRASLRDLNGRSVDLAGSLGAALRLVLPMIGLTILSTLGMVAGTMLFIVPGIILYIMWIVAVPALVEERLGVVESLGRSRQLTKGSRWAIFALILLSLVFYVIVAGVSGLFSVNLPLENPPLYAAMTAAGTVVSSMVLAAMVASLYIELRTVKEGASADSLASIFD